MFLGDRAHREPVGIGLSEDDEDLKGLMTDPELLLERASEDVPESVRGSDQVPEREHDCVIAGQRGRGGIKVGVSGSRLIVSISVGAAKSLTDTCSVR